MPWATMFNMVQAEKRHVESIAKKLDETTKRIVNEILSDSAMYRDSLRATYQRLLDLERQIKEAIDDDDAKRMGQFETEAKDSVS